MNSTVVSSILLVGIVVVAVLIVVLLVRQRTAPAPDAQLAANLQSVAQSLSQVTLQAATMAEKLAQIEPVTRAVATLQVELRGLTERLGHVEQSQQSAARGVGDLSKESSSSFSELRAIAKSLSEATESLRHELALAKNDLTEIKTHEKGDKEASARVAESLRRLETVLAGTQSKGAAGENVLELIFANLPEDWQVRNFRVAGRPCEFGLKLPNNLILPVDSKWPATDLLERFAAAPSVTEEQSIRKEIEACVLGKAREVEKYIEPSVTTNIGVAVVPDAVYDLCPNARLEAFGRNVAIISYRMFLPYLLLVYQMALSTTQSIDLQKLEAFVKNIQKISEDMLQEVDGRLSRGITMLANSRDDLRVHASRLGAGAVALRVESPAIDDVATLPATTN